MTNSEIQKCYQNEPRFNGVYSKDVDGYSDVGTHWIALYALKIMLLILAVLELNIFQKKFKTLLRDLQSQQIFIECKHMIQ